MAKIKIPFNAWSKTRLYARTKTCTARTKRYGKPGDTFEVDGQKFKLVRVERIELQKVARYYFAVEGCISCGHFVEIWCELHPKKKYQPHQRVYLHIFEEVRR